MIQFVVNGLIIHKSRDKAEKFSLDLLNRMFPTPFEVCHSCHSALELFCESPFDICLISEDFTGEELAPLFKDLQNVSVTSPCVLVRIASGAAVQPVRGGGGQLGFSAAISPDLTPTDETILLDALRDLIYRAELKRRATELESAARLLMKEIDKIYRERKKGRKIIAGRRGIRGFITQQLSFDAILLNAYIEALDEYSRRSIPSQDIQLRLPRLSDSQELPGVENGVYVGVSERVSGMLHEKFGGTDGGDDA